MGASMRAFDWSHSARWVKLLPKPNTPCSSPTGQYSLTSEYKQGLNDLAKQALTYSKGWVISVAGYADSVGNAASNQVLSKQRPQAVVAYLLQGCGVPVGRAWRDG
jgi:flagellar motor protein MotB